MSDLKDKRLQSLYLVFFHECAFTMECEEGIAEDAPIKQLESLGMQWEEPSADGSKALGDAMAQVRGVGDLMQYGMSQLRLVCG